MCFPHIGIFSFSHSECINLQKSSLQNEMYVNFVFKECFFYAKRFRPIIRVAKYGQKKFTNLYVPYIGFLL